MSSHHSHPPGHVNMPAWAPPPTAPTSGRVPVNVMPGVQARPTPFGQHQAHAYPAPASKAFHGHTFPGQAPYYAPPVWGWVQAGAGRPFMESVAAASTGASADESHGHHGPQGHADPGKMVTAEWKPGSDMHQRRFRRRPDELDRPFACSLCTKVFSTVSSLALHVRLKHVEQVEQLVRLPEDDGPSRGAPCTNAGGGITRLTPANIRSFAIASNWALPVIHTSHRYQKRLQSSAFGRACLWAMVEPLRVLTPQDIPKWAKDGTEGSGGSPAAPQRRVRGGVMTRQQAAFSDPDRTPAVAAEPGSTGPEPLRVDVAAAETSGGGENEVAPCALGELEPSTIVKPVQVKSTHHNTWAPRGWRAAALAVPNVSTGAGNPKPEGHFQLAPRQGSWPVSPNDPPPTPWAASPVSMGGAHSKLLAPLGLPAVGAPSLVLMDTGAYSALWAAGSTRAGPFHTPLAAAAQGAMPGLRLPAAPSQ